MPPKKGKKGKKEEEENKDVLTEVDRTFFELEIADLNRKLDRIRLLNDELETRNEELLRDYQKLDEDKADVITYLKKTLQTKTDEVLELQERVAGLEEKRETESKEFQSTIKDLQKDFSVMREQLTSEVKMLSGKLNSLEEFRAQRDNLMAKFEEQEKQKEDQEKHYEKILFETEKKFIISKDKLKKELESRLLKLARDFQDATEIRIASSTHRVIRENIAVNIELKEVLSNQAKLAGENEKLKEKERAARLALELAEQQRDTAMEKSIVHVKLIDRLTKEHAIMKDKVSMIKTQEFDFETQKKKIEKLTDEMSKLSLKVRILEQNLHVSLCEKSELKLDAQEARAEADRLREVVLNAGQAVRGAIKLTDCPLDETAAEREAARRNLLKRLLDLLTVPAYERTKSLSTVPSAAAAYRRGDLGFVPKETPKAKTSICSSYQSSILDVGGLEGQRSSDRLVDRTASLKTIYSKTIIPAVASHEMILATAETESEEMESSREPSEMKIEGPRISVVQGNLEGAIKKDTEGDDSPEVIALSGINLVDEDYDKSRASEGEEQGSKQETEEPEEDQEQDEH